MNTHLNKTYLITKTMNKSTYEKSVELINSTTNKLTASIDIEIFNLLSSLNTEYDIDLVSTGYDKIEALENHKTTLINKGRDSINILDAEYLASKM